MEAHDGDLFFDEKHDFTGDGVVRIHMANAFENEGMMRDDKVRTDIRGVLRDGGCYVKRKQHF